MGDDGSVRALRRVLFCPALRVDEHDLQMVADLADRIHMLDYGRTLAEGPPADVARDASFISHPIPFIRSERRRRLTGCSSRRKMRRTACKASR